jgi:hypothetical protein
MTKRWTLLLVGLSLCRAASAEDTDSGAIRQAMFAAADTVYSSVEGGGGIVSTSFGIDRAERMLFPFESPERENWQFWPTTRVGLSLEYMSAMERRATHDLLASVLSSQGYLKAVQIMQLEQILDALDEGGIPRSVDHYVLAIFGEPSISAPWGWRFEGHHVSLSVTVTNEGVAVTPSFFGSNPAQVLSGPLAGMRVHGQIEDLARDLVTSMNPDQRTDAITDTQAPGEIFTANMNKPRSDWNLWLQSVEPVGIPTDDLNEMQQHWVGLIIDEIFGNYRPDLQASFRESLDAGSLRFAWMGAIERGAPHYFRLQGSDFLYEYDNVQNGGNHVHSVWRSKGDDFGAGVLQRHYAAAH